jgi:hypothetical protein
VVVESKNAYRHETAPQRLNPLRCPACYMIQGCTLRDFSCTLTRCPRTFIDIQPSNKVAPAGALDLGDLNENA